MQTARTVFGNSAYIAGMKRQKAIRIIKENDHAMDDTRYFCYTILRRLFPDGMTGSRWTMFHKFLNWIRSVVNWLIPKKTVESAIKTQVAVSSRMADAIDLWCKVYQDKAPWTHDETVKSMGLLPAISGEVARLVTLEFASEITGSGRADYLEKQYIPVKKKLRQYTEYAVGKGGLVFKPYISGGDILVDMVQAESFLPDWIFLQRENQRSGIFGTENPGRRGIYQIRNA